MCVCVWGEQKEEEILNLLQEMENIILYVLILVVVIAHKVKGNILSFIFLLFLCLFYD